MTLASEQFIDEMDVGVARERPRRYLALAGIAVLLAVFAGAIWFAYRAGMNAGSDSGVPVIVAETGPIKVRPTDPGGLDVPHRNVLVYDRFGPQQNKRPAEQLLPRPEEPISRSAIPLPPPVVTKPSETVTLRTSDGPVAAEEPTRGPTGEELGTRPPEQPAPPEAPTLQGSIAPGYRVQLAALRSEAEAKETWERLQRSYPGLLSTLQAQVTRTDTASRGVYYRLQAGPLSEKILAEMLCGELKSRKQECLIVQP